MLAGECLVVDAYHARPINKLAAMVTQSGVSYNPNVKATTIESATPLKVRPLNSCEIGNSTVIDIEGIRFGRFVVVGKHADSKGWVCRCDCGTYCVKNKKAALNKANSHDRCSHCLKLARLKKSDYFRRTGKDRGVEYY